MEGRVSGTGYPGMSAFEKVDPSDSPLDLPYDPSAPLGYPGMNEESKGPGVAVTGISALSYPTPEEIAPIDFSSINFHKPLNPNLDTFEDAALPVSRMPEYWVCESCQSRNKNGCVFCFCCNRMQTSSSAALIPEPVPTPASGYPSAMPSYPGFGAPALGGGLGYPSMGQPSYKWICSHCKGTNAQQHSTCQKC